MSPDFTIGKPRIHFEEVDSTNEVARKLIDKGEVSEGTIITADIQTRGRGQFGRVWNSESSQNVLLSIILAPSFLPVVRQFDLNRAVSMAVLKTVQDYCFQTTIKWPNDIYAGDRKIAGILIQNFIQGRNFAHSIVGIGLNVHQKSWPPEVPNATSIALESDSEVTIDELLGKLCRQMTFYYDLLKNNDSYLNQEYVQHLFRLHQITSFTSGNNPFTGMIHGVDDLGRLQVEQNGRIEAYNHGEISMIL